MLCGSEFEGRRKKVCALSLLVRSLDPKKKIERQISDSNAVLTIFFLYQTSFPVHFIGAEENALKIKCVTEYFWLAILNKKLNCYGEDQVKLRNIVVMSMRRWTEDWPIPIAPHRRPRQRFSYWIARHEAGIVVSSRSKLPWVVQLKGWSMITEASARLFTGKSIEEFSR